MRTQRGRELPSSEIDRLSDVAERGFDLSSWRPRRGRPALDPRAAEPSPRIAVRLNGELHNRVSGLAASQGRSISEVVRGLLVTYAAEAAVDRVPHSQAVEPNVIVLRTSTPIAHIDTGQVGPDGLIPARSSRILGFIATPFHIGAELQTQDETGQQLPATIARVEGQRLLLQVHEQSGGWSLNDPAPSAYGISKTANDLSHGTTTTSQA